MEHPPKRFVLFASVLGFRRLVLEHGIPILENLEFRNRDAYYSLSAFAEPRNPMAKGFTGFHGAVHRAIDRAVWRDAELMVFSDSLFLATPEASECMEFASDLMRHAIAADVALRMGVGFGTFISYGFSFHQNPSLKFSSSQFFGSGVVYATEAEKALKGCGMRIGIHMLAASEMKREPILADRLIEPEIKWADVPCEWNYLGDITADRRVDEGARRDILLTHVRRMMEAAPADDHIRGQYRHTTDALMRMAVRPLVL